MKLLLVIGGSLILAPVVGAIAGLIVALLVLYIRYSFWIGEQIAKLVFGI